MFSWTAKKDEAYVDSSETSGQTRPYYGNARPTVEARQNMRQLSNGNWAYDSVINNGTSHVLNQYGQEAIPRQDGMGYNYQQPALDHKIQYAALNEHYHSVVQGERQRAGQGMQRRHSFDLHQAFSKAVADPDNLRLVSHDEHTSFGGSKRMGQFTFSEMADAKKLFDGHLKTVKGSTFDHQVFEQSRPKSSAPLNGYVAPSDRQTRASNSTKSFKSFFD